jgi:hypothetical protein
MNIFRSVSGTCKNAVSKITCIYGGMKKQTSSTPHESIQTCKNQPCTKAHAHVCLKSLHVLNFKMGVNSCEWFTHAFYTELHIKTNRHFSVSDSERTSNFGPPTSTTTASSNSIGSWICNFRPCVGQVSGAWVVAIQLNMQTKFFIQWNFNLVSHLKMSGTH